MTTRFILPCLLLAAGLFGGCMFWKKDDKPKESSEIASEVEASFRQRWVDRRTNQLTAQGVAAEAARAQATQEFSEKFDFNKPGK